MSDGIRDNAEDRHIEQRRNYIAVKRTMFIGKLKFGILGIIIILVLAIAVLPLTNFGKPGFKLTFERNENDVDDGSPTMMRPRLHGINDNNQPYNVAAEKAVQLDQKIVELHDLNADIYTKDGSWINLSANQGIYDANIREVGLEGNVNLFVDNGYELATNSAKVFLKSSIIQGKEPVTVHGPMGVVKANEFYVNGHNSRIKFSGGVHLTAYPKTIK